MLKKYIPLLRVGITFSPFILIYSIFSIFKGDISIGIRLIALFILVGPVAANFLYKIK